MYKPTLNLLAFESSCDDTSVAFVQGLPSDDFPKLISWSVQSQNEVHQRFGGVVPELASRAHLRNLNPCLRKVLDEGGIRNLSEIDVFSATAHPGLIGCLLVGHTAAKTLSYLYQRPFISVDHLEAHLNSLFLQHRPEPPFLALLASGGHTSLYKINSFDDYELIGETRDDAMGEAFDKGAKLLGLGFPGGPELEALALGGSEMRYPLGSVQMPGFDFSFSGLKSEFARLINREGDSLDRKAAAASYQKVLVDHLMQICLRASASLRLRKLALVGGVARNQYLRDRLTRMASEGLWDELIFPDSKFCTDNAAMVAFRAWRLWKRAECDSMSSDVTSTKRRSKSL